MRYLVPNHIAMRLFGIISQEEGKKIGIRENTIQFIFTIAQISGYLIVIVLESQGLMADFGEAGTAEVDGRGRRDDTLLSRRTRPTVLTEKRGRDGKQSVAPSSPRDAD